MSKEAERVFLTNLMKNRIGDFPFPIAMPNANFNIPVNAVYGEFYLVSGPKPIIAAGEGKGKVRTVRVGFVQLTVWVPKDKGTKSATTAQDIFENIYQMKLGRDTAGQVYHFGLIEDYTPTTKAGWECFVFRVPYKRSSVEEVQVHI